MKKVSKFLSACLIIGLLSWGILLLIIMIPLFVDQLNVILDLVNVWKPIRAVAIILAVLGFLAFSCFLFGNIRLDIDIKDKDFSKRSSSGDSNAKDSTDAAKSMQELSAEDIADIALKRCKELSGYYFEQKMRDLRRYRKAKIVSLVLTAITPVLLLIPINGEWVKIFAAATSSGAAISTGVLSIYGWRETFVRSGYTYHALESEMNRYRTKASDDYADPNKAAQKFAKRIEDLYMVEVTDWRSEMRRIELNNNVPATAITTTASKQNSSL